MESERIGSFLIEDKSRSWRRKTAAAIRNPRAYSQAAAWIALAFFIILYLITVQATPGDTGLYQTEIFRYARTPKPGLLFEFGHLFWRPLAYGIWQITQPLTARWFGGNQALEINSVLFGINFVSGGVLSIVVLSIGRRLGLRSAPALSVTAGVLLCSVVLNYMHSGTAYLPGLALSLVGVWLLLKGLQNQQHRHVYAAFAGAALALAVDFWFVYILSLPAAFLAAAVIPLDDSPDKISQRFRKRMVLLIIAASTTAALGILTFLIGAAICHISTVSQLRAWIVNSGHSLTAERRFLRFPTGITRTFFYLGDDGKTLKRFVFGDPYAPVRWFELIGAGLFKVVLVFAASCAFLWSLAGIKGGPAALAVALAGIIPTLWFALFLFETGQPERYLPFYPALLIAVCIFLCRPPKQQLVNWVAAVFLCALALVNLNAYAFDLRVKTSQTTERVKLVHRHTLHGGVALILFYDDPLSSFAGSQPFNPENVPDVLPLYLVMELKSRAPWNAGSSCRILATWQAGGEAWLSKRLIASRPKPDWEWVENDHPAVPWTKLSRFFNELDRDFDIGGADGFVRIAPTGKNRLLLEDTCGKR